MLEQQINATHQRLGLPQGVDLQGFNNIFAAFAAAADKYKDKPAFTSLGNTLTFAELRQEVDAFTAYLQNYTDLQVGDRIAIQLPNLVQYPVVMFGALQAGLVIVNTNPLYTHRELEHQFNDAGVKALVVASVVAADVEAVLAKTDIKHVIITDLADLHSPLKRVVLNAAVKYLKKMVKPYDIRAGKDGLISCIKLPKALAKGRAHPAKTVSNELNALAVLQYTGGTTGLAKGAMLSHGNLLSNTLQCTPFFATYGFGDGQETLVQPLPLYHIYAFIVSMILIMTGNHTVLIPNPRDIPGFVKELSKHKLTGMCGLNTLFVALCNNDDFKNLDFSQMKMTLSGGMALTSGAAHRWHELTGVEIYEGYGLTETSPVISVNPGTDNRIGSIGVPLPGTQVRIVNEAGEALGVGEAGELCVKGPQVMQGYWQQAEETAKVMDAEGWFHTGDVAVIGEDGFMKIVDRIKDMILVSGFNVYPNEIEDVVSSHPLVVESAAIGIEDERSGESVKVFVVRSDDSLSEADLINFCREKLTAYKIPRSVEFRDELPKSNVGKVLRRMLRDA